MLNGGLVFLGEEFGSVGFFRGFVWNVRVSRMAHEPFYVHEWMNKFPFFPICLARARWPFRVFDWVEVSERNIVKKAFVDLFALWS